MRTGVVFEDAAFMIVPFRAGDVTQAVFNIDPQGSRGNTLNVLCQESILKTRLHSVHPPGNERAAFDLLGDRSSVTTPAIE